MNIIKLKLMSNNSETKDKNFSRGDTGKAETALRDFYETYADGDPVSMEDMAGLVINLLTGGLSNFLDDKSYVQKVIRICNDQI